MYLLPYCLLGAEDQMVPRVRQDDVGHLANWSIPARHESIVTQNAELVHRTIIHNILTCSRSRIVVASLLVRIRRDRRLA